MSQSLAQIDLQALLSGTPVGQLDLTQVPLLAREQTLSDAATAMREVRHGSALVCEAERLVGIITERDVLRAAGDGDRMNATVDTVMTPRPRTLSLDDTVLNAVQWMDRGGYRRLPVVDADGCPVGLIDVMTVVNFLVEQIPSTVYNQASRKMLTVQQCEGA
ncbi:MAG TPA: CBS domain-containing protein [Planctomycetaceae bacterium]|nr:CBS domain-containing protein [Planctomycetaceae bacterium]